MDFELPQCYGHDVRIARKLHKCCECKGTIQPGEKYHYHHGVWDGEALSYKVCVDCENLRKDCDGEAHYDKITPFGYLHETVDGMFSSDPKLFIRFVEIMQRRGAIVPPWMVHRANESIITNV